MCVAYQRENMCPGCSGRAARAQAGHNALEPGLSLMPYQLTKVQLWRRCCSLPLISLTPCITSVLCSEAHFKALAENVHWLRMCAVRVQTIHFIRHAEGFHNIGWEQNDDAHLTSRGWQQAAALRRHVSSLALPLNVQACPGLELQH